MAAELPAACAPVTRELIHTREIVCNGYRRSDGLFDIESSMKDISTNGTTLLFRQLAPGDLMHDMRVNVTFDAELVIREIQVHTDASPMTVCADSNSRYEALKGLKIGPGFTKKVKALLGGTQGCTHLTELLGPLATTAVQTFYANVRETQGVQAAHFGSGSGPMARPLLVDTCQAYRSDGQVMQLIWPPHRRAG